MGIPAEDSLDNIQTVEILIDYFAAIKRALAWQGRIRYDIRAIVSNEKKRLSSLHRKPAIPKWLETVRKSNEVLHTANSIFPFQLFPDTITIDREKVTIIQRIFFAVSKTISVHTSDMLSVEADTGPFFGSVKLTSKYFSNNPQTITWLTKNDAHKIQRLLQGYIIVHQKDIECSKMDKRQLVKMLERIGQVPKDY